MKKTFTVKGTGKSGPGEDYRCGCMQLKCFEGGSCCVAVCMFCQGVHVRQHEEGLETYTATCRGKTKPYVQLGIILFGFPTSSPTQIVYLGHPAHTHHPLCLCIMGHRVVFSCFCSVFFFEALQVPVPGIRRYSHGLNEYGF